MSILTQSIDFTDSDSKIPTAIMDNSVKIYINGSIFTSNDWSSSGSGTGIYKMTEAPEGSEFELLFTEKVVDSDFHVISWDDSDYANHYWDDIEIENSSNESKTGPVYVLHGASGFAFYMRVS